MKEKIIAKRYAEAFLISAKATIGLEKSVNELKELKILLFGSPDFQKFLESLEITFAEKEAVIDAILKGFTLETRQFIKLLIDKGRIKSIMEICDYVRIHYGYGEAMDVLLKTTYPLDLDLIQKIKGRLEAKFNRKLNFHIELDPDLLGGIQVIIGNIVINGSVQNRLNELREKLLSVQV